MISTSPRIAPCLWFDHQAEEAAQFYTSIFPDSKIVDISRYTEAGQEIHQKPPGSVMTVDFELDAQPFTALNGGPLFQFTEAVSFQVFCDSQEQLDRYWDQLREDGDPTAQQCGWLKDKFGVTWQVVPTALVRMMREGTPQQRERVLGALMPMKKLDIASLEAVYRD